MKMLSSIYPQQKAGTEPKSVMTKKSSKAVSRKSASSSTSREASPAEGKFGAARSLRLFNSWDPRSRSGFVLAHIEHEKTILQRIHSTVGAYLPENTQRFDAQGVCF